MYLALARLEGTWRDTYHYLAGTGLRGKLLIYIKLDEFFHPVILSDLSIWYCCFLFNADHL